MKSKNVVGFIWVFTLLCFSFNFSSLFAQKHSWIYFKDKDTLGFDPYQYFDSFAIQQKLATHTPIKNYTDIPVNPEYVTALRNIADSVGYQSRWLNAVEVFASQKQLGQIKKLSFVVDIQPVHLISIVPAELNFKDSLAVDEKEVLDKQLSLMKGEEFISRGINGRGIRIAVFDGGFAGMDKSPLFKKLFEEGRIVKTYDFVKKKDFVYDYMTHGTKVMSCLAGIYNGKPLGLATGAEYLLARTEIKPEKHIEEQYWLEAMEWADKNGANIISSSLGYTNKLYPIESMDGKTSLVAKAARIAAARGILVVNAMGNDGNSPWEIMGTPADVDSVLSVGGISPYTGYHVKFSSFGPTVDKRLKPNVCASGIAITAGGDQLTKSYGTSFATPLVSGFAACVWQLNREKKNIDIFNLIEQSSHLYPYFDYAHGYGIPQASFFFEKPNIAENSFDIVVKNDSIFVEIKDLNVRLAQPEDYLYYHIQDKTGYLKHYAVVKVNQPDPFQYPLLNLSAGDQIVFFYKNCIRKYAR